MSRVSWAENCLNPRLEGHWLINGLCPAGSQQWGQPCRGVLWPGQSTSHQWPAQGHKTTWYPVHRWHQIRRVRWHAKWQSFNQKDTAQLLRTGPGNTSQGPIEVERSAPGTEKSCVLGSDVWAAALPKTSRHLQKVPGCKRARGALSLQDGILNSALHR